MWVVNQNGTMLADCNKFYIKESLVCNYCYIYSEHGKLGTYYTKKNAEKVMSVIGNSIRGFGNKQYRNPWDCPGAGHEYHGIFLMPSADSVENK